MVSRESGVCGIYVYRLFYRAGGGAGFLVSQLLFRIQGMPREIYLKYCNLKYKHHYQPKTKVRKRGGDGRARRPTFFLGAMRVYDKHDI